MVELPMRLSTPKKNMSLRPQEVLGSRDVHSFLGLQRRSSSMRLWRAAFFSYERGGPNPGKPGWGCEGGGGGVFVIAIVSLGKKVMQTRLPLEAMGSGDVEEELFTLGMARRCATHHFGPLGFIFPTTRSSSREVRIRVPNPPPKRVKGHYRGTLTSRVCPSTSTFLGKKQESTKSAELRFEGTHFRHS